MSELETFRDHCQRMATRTHSYDCDGYQRSDCGAQGLEWVLTCPEPAPHDHHTWHYDRFDWTCPGLCTGCMPEAERALWQRLAAEVTAHLTDDNQPALGDL